MTRADGRGPGDLRPLQLKRGYSKFAEGSILIEAGDTRVLVTATVEDRVPGWLRGSGQGWVSAEYGMLPRATPQRTPREAVRGRPGGRSMEIQRLVGRSLRAVVDLHALGERTIWLDCDVLQADGGTRTLAITGASIALADALDHLRLEGAWTYLPLTDLVAAVSVGIVNGRTLLDLDFEEDSGAEVDLNLVMSASGGLIEVQGTGERGPFPHDRLTEMLELGRQGIARLVDVQRQALGDLVRLVGVSDDPSA